MTDQNTVQTHAFQAEVSQVLSLVVNSLYSNKEVFLRELISNAADALDKLRFASIAEPALLPTGHAPTIRLLPDEAGHTLTVWDNGIGMSHDVLVKDLGTVAHSGTKALVEKLRSTDQKDDLRLIGQFGVGFYSGYLVADRIDVISRAAGSSEAWKWSSDGRQSFTVEPAEREQPGTSVVLHLVADQHEYETEWRLRELVTRYSDFISHPIELQAVRDKDGGKQVVCEVVNRASALWMRSEKDLTDAEYDDFYKHLTRDIDAPLARAHFHVEGTQMFVGLLFLPKRAPFDLGDPHVKHGVRLYVRRVLIMEQCDELVPRWLRFVRGVIDSDDLPLNVSRELLQDSAVVRTIKKQVTRRVLDLLGKLAEERPADYLEFWKQFGAVLKEGLHFDASYADKLAPLLRYESSASEGHVSLAEYVKRMPEGQTKIYYALGPTRALIAGSPHLEALAQRGYEVLYMTHGVDQWAVDGLREFEGKPLCDAMREDAVVDGKDVSEADKNARLEQSRELVGLLARVKLVLQAHVSDVRVSERLTESPACLVIPMGGLPAHIERLLRAHEANLPEQRRILELNPKHPIVARMRDEHDKSADSAQLTEWIELIYDQALLAEGSPLPDPQRFSKRFVSLLQRATSHQV